MAGNGKEQLAKFTSWLGFACGVLSVIVFFFQFTDLSPSIGVSGKQFIQDSNRSSWRMTMFTFVPDVFVDIWTPFVMGMISILCHVDQFDFNWMCKSYGHFFVWNLVLGLFGNIGYSGIIGIIASAFTFLCCLLSLVCAFVVPDNSAKLGVAKDKF